MRTKHKALKYVLLGVPICVYLGIFAYLYINQERLEYSPSKRAFESCEYGEKIHASPLLRWLRVHQTAPHSSQSSTNSTHFVFFHGNASSACERGKVVVAALSSMNSDIDLIEYPGFGEAAREPSESQILAAIREWAEVLKKDTSVKNQKLILLGESLGTGVATYASTLIDSDGLVLFSPYTSTVDVGQDRYPFLPIRWMMRDSYDAFEWATQTRAKKVLVFHGALDKIIPIEIGENQLKNFHVPTEYVRYPDRQHNLLKNNSDLWQRVKAFAAN